MTVSNLPELKCLKAGSERSVDAVTSPSLGGMVPPKERGFSMCAVNSARA